jgi:tetratricopeptide (TPR) repeat protein
MPSSLNTPRPKPQPCSQVNPVQQPDISLLFKQGLAFHQQGQLALAKAAYEQVLLKNPRHFDALHLSGVIEIQRKNPTLAVELINNAIFINPNSAAAYCNRGNALHDLNRLEESIASYDRAISIKPDFAEAYSNRGNLLKDLNRLNEAVASYDRAIALNPKLAEAHSNRGNALKELGRLDEAIASYDHAIALTPNLTEAHNNRGNVLKELKRLQEAVASFDRAILVNPDYAEAHYNRGNALKELRRVDEAIASYDRAISVNPDYAEAYYNRGNALQELRRAELLVESYDRAIAVKPDYAEAYYNRGNALKELSRAEEALASFDRAIAAMPDYAEAYTNRGNVLQELKRLEEAVASYDCAIAINPDDADAYWNKSFALLLSGNFNLGWELYEWRWRKADTAMRKRNFIQPLWLGVEDLADKTILLHAEQGLGDTIQFCRYASLVKARGARVVMEVPQALVGMLSDLNGVDELAENGGPLPAFDYHSPLMSLPLAFKTELSSIPSPSAYLAANAEKCKEWENILGEKARLRVGLVWSGSAGHKNDHNRSLTLQKLIPHLPEGCEFVSLQKELREVDKEMLADSGIRNYGDNLKDFTDTAALCELMDVVVSVDTSVAHLAAAMGKATWILLPYAPDWRWLLDRGDSPWYECVKLYRQDESRNWGAVLNRVAADLRTLHTS